MPKPPVPAGGVICVHAPAEVAASMRQSWRCCSGRLSLQTPLCSASIKKLGVPAETEAWILHTSDGVETAVPSWFQVIGLAEMSLVKYTPDVVTTAYCF